MVNVLAFSAILEIITMFMPVVDWVIERIEKLFQGKKTGEEKKAIAMKSLSSLRLDPKMVSVVIDTAVETKNATGEFSHGAVTGPVSGTEGASEASALNFAK